MTAHHTPTGRLARKEHYRHVMLCRHYLMTARDLVSADDLRAARVALRFALSEANRARLSVRSQIFTALNACRSAAGVN